MSFGYGKQGYVGLRTLKLPLIDLGKVMVEG